MSISVAANTQEQIRRMILEAIRAAQAAGELPEGDPADYAVEVPADTAKGDFATNAAMVNAKAFRMPPGSWRRPSPPGWWRLAAPR